MKRLLAVAGVAALAAIGLAAGLVTSDVAAEGGPKVFVCKYVGTPGSNERLQTGDNPINVSANSIKEWNGQNPGNLIGLEFADAQGFSRVIAIDAGQAEPSCPGLPTLVEITATAPTLRDPTCDVDADVILPTVTGVTYAVMGTVAPGETVEVQATANEGYVLVGTVEWMHTFGNVPDNCAPPPGPPTEVTPGVAFQDPTCDVGAAVIPTTTTGLAYTVDGKVAPGEEVTVTASANDGYTIIGNNSWEHTFGQVPTNCTGPTTPTTPTTPTPTTPTPTTPTAPLAPPTTKPTATKPAATKPAVKKPAAKAAPAAPKKAVAGAYAQEKPTLAYTP